MPIRQTCRARTAPLILLYLAVCIASSAAANTVLLLADRDLPGEPLVVPRTLRAGLEEAGVEAHTINAYDFVRSGALDPERTAVLILTSAAFPLEAREALLQYLRAGGDLVLLGGPPLQQLVVRHHGRWVPLAEHRSEDDPPHLVDDFADDELRWQEEHGPKTVVSLERDEAKGCLSVTVPDMLDWGYARLDGATPPGDDYALLAFRARGDERTPLLCLELRGTDGSRWKHWVELRPEWTEYVVPVGDFLSYATEGRGAPGDYLRPSEIASVQFGLYGGLVPDGGHRFRLDDVAWRHCPVGPGRLSLTSHHADLQPRLKITDPGGPLPLCVAGKPQPARLALGDALSPLSDLGARARGTEPVEHWPVSVERTAHRLERRDPAADEPFVAKVGASRTPDGAVRPLLVTHYAGPFAGSRWAVFPFADVRPEGQEALAATAAELIRAMLADPAALTDMDVTFGVTTRGVTATIKAQILNLADERRHPALRIGALTQRGPTAPDLALAATELPPKQTASVEASRLLPPEALRFFALRVTLTEGHGRDVIGGAADPRAELQAICEWLLAQQTEAGSFSNHYFVDAYSSRALLAASVILKETKYRDAALRWADFIVADQNDDGSWWVGYGPPREEVYVADDGSIALGLSKLYEVADEERRARYLTAMKRYRAFRESFRNQEGGLGVGFTSHDYFVKPVGRGDTVKREMRGYPWTVGCSLAFVGKLAQITGREADRRLAISDARYLLEAEREKPWSFAQGYYPEALLWVYETTQDEELRQEVLQGMQAGMERSTCHPTDATWWHSSGGRNALALSQLAWYYERVEERPDVLAAMFRGLWQLCAEGSPHSLSHKRDRARPGDILQSFAALGLAEVVAPGITLPQRE